ncbi:MAG: M48 family metallopeptidase [Verrucomicrobiales bacterium]|nr:M48 family metallopeptidase [Verrucomicrobiales bacterium]
MAGLILARLGVALWLAWLNRRHVQLHAAEVPEPYRGVIDGATYAKAIRYALAKNRFGQVAEVYSALVLISVSFSGVLPGAYSAFTARLGTSAWAASAFLVGVAACLQLAELPLDWYAVFRLEQRFGFNTSTLRIWVADKLKESLITVALLYPVAVVVVKLLEPGRGLGWFWAWVALMCVQVLIVIVAPVLILPLFNKFVPLSDGELRQRLIALAQRAGVRIRDIEVMDGSRRSRHSNAFFTGLGPFRKIVLFDTLVGQLSPPELEAVLAHEIGHFKLKHVPIRIAVSAAGALLGFWAVSILLRSNAFYEAFGFEPGSVAPALLLSGLLAGTVAFWLMPLAQWLARRHEHAADKFAARLTGGPAALISALRKLEEKNLGNLVPHPLFSRFYYSHPTLLERERALRASSR